MTHSLIARTTAPAAAVALGLLGLVAAPTPSSAAPTTTPAARSADRAAAPTGPVKRSRIDIDGDGRADSTTFRKVGFNRGLHRFLLETRTATGRRARMSVTLPDEGTNLTTDYVWVGAAGVDGVRGGEVVLDLWTVGDFPDVRVYTFRGGRFVNAPAPGSRRSGWMVANHGMLVAGYTFSTVRGTRQVVAHELNGVQYGGPYRGTHTTYRWGRAGWVRVATRPSGLVPDATAQRHYSGLFGLRWR